MDGLEDQAEAALAGLIQQLYTTEVVEVKHSSRDNVIFRLAEELRTPDVPGTIVTKSLVLRSGISMAGLRMLQEALKVNDTMEELEFVCLRSIEELQSAIECCRLQPRIHRLCLKNYKPPTTRRTGQGRERIAQTIRDSVFGNLVFEDDDIENHRNVVHSGIPTLQTLEIVGCPIGSEGAQVLVDVVAQNKTLTTLKLMDCDLRSDSAKSIAHMIKGNTTLKELDLSYNRQILGALEIQREMTLKTLVQRGLRCNLSLLQLKMEHTRDIRINRSKIDKQLDISRFRETFVQDRRDPFAIEPVMWSHLLARVSAKPSALYFFLQESVVALCS